MSKITQRELLEEGFLDTIRQAAGNITKPLARVTAGALGGVGKAALQVGKDIVTGNTGATLSNVARQGVSGAVNAYKSERDKQINASPERFLENELKTNWTKVFDPASIKITKQQDAAPAFHKSFRLSKVNKFFVYFEANHYKDIGGVERIKCSAAITRDINGKFALEGIEDIQGNSISNSGSKETLPKLNDLMKKLNFNINNSPVNRWTVALKRSFGNKMQDPRKDIDKLIPAALGNDGYILTPADVALLRQHLKDEMLISEKNTQKDLLLQLKLLNASYKSMNNTFYIK